MSGWYARPLAAGGLTVLAALVTVVAGPRLLVPGPAGSALLPAAASPSAGPAHAEARPELVPAVLPQGLSAAAAESAPAGPPVARSPLADQATPRLAPTPAGVLGRLVSPEGEARAGVVVTLRPEDGAGVPRPATSGPDGLVQLDGVAPGSYRLELGPHAEPFVPARCVTVEAPLTRLGELVVPPDASLEIRVLDALGTPVPDVSLECVGYPVGRALARSDQDGAARFDGLVPGAGRVFARDPRLGRGNAPFELVAGMRGRVELHLVPRGGPAPERQPPLVPVAR